MMKPKKRPKGLTLAVGVYLVLMLVAIISTPTFAAAASKITQHYMMDYNQYFVIDATRDGLFGWNPLASMANGLFMLHKWFIKLLAGLIELSYTFDLYNIIEKQFNVMFKPMKSTFFDGFFPIAGAIFILAVLFMFKAGGRTSEAFENFLKGMAILVFALWFMRNPADSMSNIKNVTDLANGELIKNTTASQGVDAKTQYKIIADNFYTTNVVEIWRILNFSSAGIDDSTSVAQVSKKYEKDLLSQLPYSAEREETVSRLREEVKIDEGSVLFTILLVMILSIPDIAVTLVLAGINFATDGLTLLLALIAPIIFIFTLIPSYGSRLFMSWISKILFFFGLTVATTILLSYYMSFSNILLANQVALGGLVGVYFVKAVIIVTIYIFRDKLKFAYAAVGHGRRGMERGVKEMGLDREAESAKHFAIKQSQKAFSEGKGQVQKYMKERKKSTDTASDTSSDRAPKPNVEDPTMMDQTRRSKLAESILETNLKKQIHQAKQKAVELEDTFGVQFEPDYGKWAEKVAKYEAGDDPFTGAERREMINDIYLMERAGKDPNQLLENNKIKDPTRMNQTERRAHAEKILADQLQARVDAARLRAGNGEPAYDEYTSERLRRQNAGEQVFDEKEIKAVSDGIKKYEKADGDPRRVIKRRTGNYKKSAEGEYSDPGSGHSQREHYQHDDSYERESGNTNDRGGSSQNKTSEEVHHDVHHKFKHKVSHEVEADGKIETSSQIQTVDERPSNQAVDLKAVKPRRISDAASKEELRRELEQKKELDDLQEGIQDVKRTLEEHGRGINERLKKVEVDGNAKEKE